MLTEELGFGAAINYRGEDVLGRLRDLAPQRDRCVLRQCRRRFLDAALGNLRRGARVVIGGAIASYNATELPPGPTCYMSLRIFRASMSGLVVFDYFNCYGEAVARIAEWLTDGTIKSREHVVEGGVARFGETLNMLFTGANTGKLVLAI